MKIGCPTEIKPQEYRVGMTPDAAREAVNHHLEQALCFRVTDLVKW